MRDHGRGQCSETDKIEVWWKKLWSLRLPNKIKICTWRAFHGILPSLDALKGRKVNVETRCPRCHTKSETLMHALVECPKSNEIWQNTIFAGRLQPRPQGNMAELLLDISYSYSKEDLEVFCLLIWAVWWERNRMLHGEKPMVVARVVEKASFVLAEYHNTLQQTSACGEKQLESRPQDRWIPSTRGRLKLNTDAAVNKEHGVTGLGGVIRDEKGEVLGAFAKRHHGAVEPHLAECLALRAGLVFAMESGLLVDYIECDAVNVVNEVNGVNNSHEAGLVLEDIKLLMQSVGSDTCNHVRRCCNRVAHLLAHFAFSVNLDCFWLEEYPINVASLVIAEMASS